MEAKFITLTKENIDKEHICCAFSDKKCKVGYELKKEWLKREFDNGYVFRRLDERAKVFMEYVPAEKAWIPVEAPNYLMINCFWVSGQYQKKGYAKALLQSVLDDAQAQNKNGLVTVAGASKFHFMSDTKWLMRQGFEVVAKLPSGFVLLVKKLKPEAKHPTFKEQVLSGECPDKDGLVVYYSDRCPYMDYYVRQVLPETAKERGMPLKLVKLDTLEEAQAAPSPATIFSLFHNGLFITTDVSVCLANRFAKMFKTP